MDPDLPYIAITATTPTEPLGKVTWGLWILLCFFLVCSAFFSGSETALFSLGKLRLHKVGRESKWGFRRVSYLLRHANDTLATILLSNTFVNIGAALTAGILAEYYIKGYPLLSFFTGAIGITFVILLLGEIVPKTLAISKSITLAPLVAFPLYIISYLLKPILKLFFFISDSVFKLLRIQPSDPSFLLDGKELKVLLTSVDASSLLETEEQEMINGVFEFRETIAEEIMTPRTEIESYPINTSQEKMVENAKRSEFSRLIIYEAEPDNVVGILHAKHLLLQPEKPFKDMLTAPLFVPPRKPLMELLAEFKRARRHLAVVVDEFGGVAGVITLHDLLEEIVGSIRDRAAALERRIKRVAEHEYLIPADTEIWEVNEELDTQLDEDFARTVAGYIINKLGRIPQVGETIKIDNYLFRIVAMRAKRIQTVQVKLLKGKGNRS